VSNIKNRKKIEEIVLKTMKLLDPYGYNENRYETMFSQMSDNQFTRFMNQMMSDDDYNFTLETTPFEKNHVDLDIRNIKKAADYLGVPLDEYIYMPFINPNGSPVRSRERVPVGYVFAKRLEQILSKKNAYSSEINQRDSKTGLLGLFKNILIA